MKLVVTHAIYFAGLAAVIHGLWLIYPPAAWIIGGAAAVFVSMMLDRGAEKR